ncbi:MAG: HDIG domain-containing protein [Deltaproteobacteria bacterium]|nr:HDIG domain-containing protein [Deltaproteobacteria bacterium]
MKIGGTRVQVAEDGGVRRYFTLGWGNPLLRYGAWLCFILLIVRLAYLGFRGVLVPEVGERATSYYVAPRLMSCEKPNPNLDTQVEKLKSEVAPVYAVDNSHIEARQEFLRSIEAKLKEDVSLLSKTERSLRSLDEKKQPPRAIKESPFYQSDASSGEEKSAGDGDRSSLSATLREVEEHACGLIASVAPGLSKAQQESLLKAFRRAPATVGDSFAAALTVLEECGRWLVVETLDFVFQRDRSRGLVLVDAGQREHPLAEAQRVRSYVEALDEVRARSVGRIISENFPRLKGAKRQTSFVTQMVVSGIRPNFRKDDARTDEALRLAVASVPRGVAVEFEQGQTIVALGEKVEEWQADCVARFSPNSAGRGASGTFLGIPVPTLLLALGIAMVVVLASLTLRKFLVRSPQGDRLTHGDYLAIGVLLVLQLGLLRLFLFASSVFSLTYPAVNKGTMLAACPVGVSVMLATLLLGVKVAFVLLLFLSAVALLMTVQAGPELLGGSFAAYYTLYYLAVSLTGIWMTRQVARRSSLFSAGMMAGIAGVLYWVAVYFVEGGQIPTNHLVHLTVASLVSGALSYIFLISLSPVFEYLWDYTTNPRLVELSSTEHPALKELSRRAPGTYQHSLWISTLVEEAASAIGCNALLAKVGAFYHDLGKLAAAAESGLPGGATDSPLFFAENQGGVNPHDHLSPSVSARILRRHVELSIKMIRKYRLGRRIEAIAEQHHGTSFMEHFYNKAVLAAQVDGTQVNEDEYRYPGPRPQNKEAALVMLADSVEAAVRSLPQHSEEKIAKRVEGIIRKKRTDGQLDESQLTFGDVKRIEEGFIKTLICMYHARPEYLSIKPDERTVRLKSEEAALLASEDETRPMRRDDVLRHRAQARGEPDPGTDPGPLKPDDGGDGGGRSET